MRAVAPAVSGIQQTAVGEGGVVLRGVRVYSGVVNREVQKCPVSIDSFTELEQTASSAAQPLPVSLDHLQLSIKISMEKHFIYSPHFIITTIITHHKTTPRKSSRLELPSSQEPLSTHHCIQALTVLSSPHTTDCWGKNSIVTALNRR